MSTTYNHYTGVACTVCGRPERFVPGYLVKRNDGSRYFTVSRVTEHTIDCTAFDDVDDGITNRQFVDRLVKVVDE